MAYYQRRRKSYGSNAASYIVGGLFGLVILALFMAPPAIHFGTMEWSSGHVIVEKERVHEKRESKYMVFTDKEVFENTDSTLSLKWNSSDVYRDIKVGDTCSFQVTGFRVPFLSWYRNIIAAKCEKLGGA